MDLPFFRLCVIASIATASSSAVGNVLVVDASGTGTFTQISAATAAAADGDVILVKSGTYASFSIVNKSLDVVADTGASVSVQGSVLVVGLSTARTATLSGLHVDAPSTALSGALRLSFCMGSVRVHGCELIGFDQPDCLIPSANGGHAVDVGSCLDVAFAACSMLGGDGSDDGGYSEAGRAGEGLRVTSSKIALYDCTLTGGEGGREIGTCPGSGYCCTYAGDGGAGARFGTVALGFFSNSTVRGGDVGIVSSPAGYGGCGGSGLFLRSGTGVGPSHVRTVQSLITRGYGDFFCAEPHLDVVVTHPSTFVRLVGLARRMSAYRLAREQQPARIEFVGQPGDRVFLRMADATRFVYSDTWRGVSLVRQPHPSPVLLAGTIGTNGTLSYGWVVPELGAGVRSRRLFLQAEFVDATGQKTLGTPATMVLLDSAF